jgi:hypothetical protein
MFTLANCLALVIMLCTCLGFLTIVSLIRNYTVLCSTIQRSKCKYSSPISMCSSQTFSLQISPILMNHKSLFFLSESSLIETCIFLATYFGVVDKRPVYCVGNFLLLKLPAHYFKPSGMSVIGFLPIPILFF